MSRITRFGLRKTSESVDRSLRYLVRSAYDHVSAYRRAWDRARISPKMIRGVEDLTRLPIMDKETLFRFLPLTEALRSGVDPTRLVRVGTSGSTGLPINVYMSHLEATYRRLLLLRAWGRLAPLGFPLTVADVGSWIEGDAPLQIQRRGPGTVARVSLALSPEEQADLLLRLRPTMISGYPTALDIVAAAYRVRADRLPVRLVACRGETLDPSTRASLQEAFGGRVGDFYNAEEVGNIAWECPEDPDALHVNTAACVVEIVDESGTTAGLGEEGRVIVTNLYYNNTMPFVRYDLHDRAALLSPAGARCACGSTAPRMRVLAGRDDDYMYLPEGRRVSPRVIATAVNRAFSNLSPLGGFDKPFRQFRIIQDAVDHVRIEIVPELGRELDYASILAPALERIHPALRCTVKTVDDLPLGPSGKYRKVTRQIGPSELAT